MKKFLLKTNHASNKKAESSLFCESIETRDSMDVQDMTDFSVEYENSEDHSQICATGFISERSLPARHAGRQPSSRNEKQAIRRFLTKKRAMMIVSAVLAVIMVPMLALASNGTLPSFKQDGAGDGTQAQAPELVQAAQQQADEAQQPAEQESADQPETQPQLTGAATAGTITPQQEGAEVSGQLAVDEEDEEQAPVSQQSNYKSLVPGENHADVIDLQKRLMELYYMENDEPTDYYGPATQLAVGYFQRKHGLTVDGNAGAETQKLLFSDSAKEYSASLGAEGLDVEGIQQRLSDLGYPVSVTGYFGPETESAVRYFQRMNGLGEDGSVGHYTKELLYSSKAVGSEEYLAGEDGEDDTADESNDNHSDSKNNTSEDNSSKNNTSEDNSSNDNTQTQPDPEPSSDPEPQPDPAPAPAADPGSVEAFVAAALAQEGKPYVLGGKGSDTFDCSGLVYYALNQSGNSIGYMTSGGWASSGYTTIGSIGDLQRGDVICIKGHVAVYLGDGMMVDASSSNGRVVVREVGSWARNNFICGKRPL